MSQTVTQSSASTPTRAPKAFYCWFHDRHGVLTKLDSEYVFRDSETEELTIIEPIDFPWIAINGEVGLTDTQQLMDQMRGGYVKIACSRLN